jgi:hypothetical protein
LAASSGWVELDVGRDLHVRADRHRRDVEDHCAIRFLRFDAQGRERLSYLPGWVAPDVAHEEMDR